MEVFIPSTFAINERDDKLLVHRIGNLARTISIFGVDAVTIYKDEDPKADEERNAELMQKYLQYAECPPYLRKQLIPRDPDLQYANILPPLQIISHGYSDEFREGAVIEQKNGTAIIEAGVDDPIHLHADLEEGMRVTLMETEHGWEPIDPADIDGFWTFTVRNERKQLGDLLDQQEKPVIGTSAKGEPLTAFKQSPYAMNKNVGVVFGSAWRGIYELIDRGDCMEEQFAGIYNFVPNQQTKTVRSGEAVPIVLSIMNALRE